ncbi:hypothetical protein PRIPAC_85041 [Pristionchus pacificus]|uniref:Uncharacterized protein n=1 Tax=Pristionchus pacificus TaxID=54126 RepID=A0A2A6BU90_PRIPA|nr:hypothetical protein PRIPAC_85041 [Pristionchus pacificus]|eukprot:PDM69542.1 hypothetical protein PRIPAC_44638 [Pristionchus pacificus]
MTRRNENSDEWKTTWKPEKHMGITIVRMNLTDGSIRSVGGLQGETEDTHVGTFDVVLDKKAFFAWDASKIESIPDEWNVVGQIRKDLSLKASTKTRQDQGSQEIYTRVLLSYFFEHPNPLLRWVPEENNATYVKMTTKGGIVHKLFEFERCEMTTELKEFLEAERATTVWFNGLVHSTVVIDTVTDCLMIFDSMPYDSHNCTVCFALPNVEEFGMYVHGNVTLEGVSGQWFIDNSVTAEKKKVIAWSSSHLKHAEIKYTLTRDPAFYNWPLVCFIAFTAVVVMIAQQFVQNKLIPALLGTVVIFLAVIVTGEHLVMQKRMENGLITVFVLMFSKAFVQHLWFR